MCTWSDYLQLALLRQFHGGFGYAHILGKIAYGLNSGNVVTSVLVTVRLWLLSSNQSVSEEIRGLCLHCYVKFPGPSWLNRFRYVINQRQGLREISESGVKMMENPLNKFKMIPIFLKSSVEETPGTWDRLLLSTGLFGWMMNDTKIYNWKGHKRKGKCDVITLTINVLCSRHFQRKQRN